MPQRSAEVFQNGVSCEAQLANLRRAQLLRQGLQKESGILKAVEIAGRLPSGVAFIVPVVRTRLSLADKECRSHEYVAALICSVCQTDLRRVLRMSQNGFDYD